MFKWLPYYPIWSVVVIALDIIAIWGIATWHNFDQDRRVIGDEGNGQ